MSTSGTRTPRSGTELGRLALLGGESLGAPAQDKHPTFTTEARRRVDEVLSAGMSIGLSKHNPLIDEAESAISAWHGVRHCLGTSTGHAALHAALIGLEVTAGDEVITTPYSWGASVSCIFACAAVPVFADVHADTGLIDARSIAPLITERTRAILVVHIFGQPADMTAIRELADRHGLAVIEDGSQAHGARHRGLRVGAFGDAAGFSCMGTKLLATTEAGYLLTPHEDVYWKAALSTQHMAGSVINPGRSYEGGFPEELAPYRDSLNYTYRLSTINAVLLTEQLRKLDRENEGRRRNVDAFRDALSASPHIGFPRYADVDEPVYYMLTMNFHAEQAGVSRDTYLAALRAEGLTGTLVYVPAPIPHWPRLGAEAGAPRSIIEHAVQLGGRRYADVSVPGCASKIANSIELVWNFIAPDPGRITRLADVFHKVDANIDALRAWERSTDTESSTTTG